MKLQGNIAEEFNEFSKNYTEDMTRCVPHYLKLLSSFTENLPENFAPQYILDLGCGNGNITSRLLKAFPEAHYTLLDASNEMLNLCKQQFSNYRVTYIESYFQEFDFPVNKYDLIAAGFSVHHCNKDEKQQLFKNIFASLKKSGVFSCSDLMIDKNQQEHPQLISFWSDFVNSNFPDAKKWSWLMDHYSTYDNPDNLNNQLSWLKQGGFSDFAVTIHDTYWTHLKAFKK